MTRRRKRRKSTANPRFKARRSARMRSRARHAKGTGRRTSRCMRCKKLVRGGLLGFHKHMRTKHDIELDPRGVVRRSKTKKRARRVPLRYVRKLAAAMKQHARRTGKKRPVTYAEVRVREADKRLARKGRRKKGSSSNVKVVRIKNTLWVVNKKTGKKIYRTARYAGRRRIRMR